MEVDREDLYTLKINCKGKRTVGKANKGKSNNRVKKLKIKVKWKKVKKENFTKLQKPSVEAEVYNNNRKCDWGKKKVQKLN